MKNAVVELRKIQPIEADTILATCQYSGQRPYRPSHASFLSEEMRRGNFKETALIVVAKTPDGKKYLANGQHTLNAIRLCNIPQTVTFFSVDSESMDDVARLYTSIDVGITRTFSDQVAALNLADELGFTPTQMNYLQAACKMIHSNFTQNRTIKKVHIDDAIGWAKDYAKYAHNYFDATFGAPKEITNSMSRAATMSVGLVSYRFTALGYGRDRIDEFWSGVTFGEMLSKDDPRNAVRSHLLTTGMNGGGYNITKYRSTISPAQSSRYIAKCLNGFLDGKLMQRPQMPSISEPIVIKCSPFNSK